MLFPWTLTALLVACPGPSTPETGDPWDLLEPTTPDSFHPLTAAVLEGDLSASRLLHLDDRSLTFALLEDRVLVMDDRFHHSERTFCLDGSTWPELADPDLMGACEEGQVSLRRGALQSGLPLMATALDVDGLRLLLLDAGGALSAVDLDVSDGNPFRFLGPAESLGSVAFPTPDGPPLPGLVQGQQMHVLLDDGLLSIQMEGGDSNILTLPGTGTDLLTLDERLLVASSGGLWLSDGDTPPDLGGIPTRLTADGAGGVWVSLVDAGRVVHLSALLVEDTSLQTSGLLGPLAFDPDTGRLYLAVADGVEVWQSQETAEPDLQALHTMSPPHDLLVSTSHEILVLTDDGLSVFSDEEALVGETPLNLFVAAFLEGTSVTESTPCLQGDVGQTTPLSFAATALANQAWLDATPASVALGIIPALATRFRQCGLERLLEPLWMGRCTSPGVLFHERRDACGDDLTCHETFMEQDLDALLALGMQPGWASGLSSYGDLDVDWVQALLALDFTDRYTFFSLSILADISHEDPHAKDAFPVDSSRLSTSWWASSAQAITSSSGQGGLLLLPGNSVPAFNLGDCPNLLVRECQLLAEGGARFQEEDMAALDVLLHRALAQRSATDPSTWYFHLPDLGQYDYTEGCQVGEVEWGEEWSSVAEEICQAGLLQAWLLDVHRRFVLNGMARWGQPDTLEPE